MARKNRVTLPNIPIHILKKGINQEDVFHNDEDYESFYNLLIDIAKKFDIKIYAYILLKNSFELIISSSIDENISKFMQNLSRQYVLYYNKKYDRTGTIWEGRFKSSLIEKDNFLNKTISYINFISKEHNIINSVRSSAKDNISLDITKKEIEFIQNSLNSGTITGSSEFIQTIKNTTGVSFFAKKRGRPKNNEIKGDKLYKNLELLSKEKHKNLKIGDLTNLLFIKNIPSFPIIPSEAELISKTFPIVFSSEENPTILAMNSMGNQNLAINSEGKWLSSYIPAVYRKYPFTYVSNKDNPEQRAVAVDMDAPHLSFESGVPLFDESANQTKFLNDIINFLTTYEQEAMKAKLIAKLIADAGILEERELSIGEGENTQLLAKGFKVVDIAKLHKLDDATLASWVRNGVIDFINLHIKSLDNMENLMDELFKRNNY